MKKIITVTLATGLLLAPAVVANAAPPPAKSYSSCKALNAKYPSGVRKSSKAVNRHARQMNRPLSKRSIVDRKKRPVSAKVYRENIRLDFDKDGIACER